MASSHQPLCPARVYLNYPFFGTDKLTCQYRCQHQLPSIASGGDRLACLFAEVQAYYKTLQSRPSWKKAITDHAHFIIEKAKLDLADITEKNPEIGQLLHPG